MSILATCLGHPRIGAGRELKRALERTWAKLDSAEALHAAAADVRRRHWIAMKSAGIDHIPCNDFSLYDHMLDMAVMVGAIPARYRGVADPLTRYFAMARGHQDPAAGIDLAALEMTKWFDTNYHYLVPELEADQAFALDATKLCAELAEARALGLEPRPVIVGPVSLLRLSKLAGGAPPEARIDLPRMLERLLPVYAELLGVLAAHGVAWIQLDEPCLVLDLDDRDREAYRRAFAGLAAVARRPRILVATYFGALGDNASLVTSVAGVDALHLDLVRAPDQLDRVVAWLGPEQQLSLGVVDGRNVWRTDLDAAHAQVRRAVRALGAERVMVAPSCSLLHVPADLAAEHKLDAELRSWLAFTAQKLDELRALADAGATDAPDSPAFAAARAAFASRRSSPGTRNQAVRARAAAAEGAPHDRASPFGVRAERQRARFRLPVLPTTTIGSFPQTADVRGARAAWRAGRMTAEAYQRFLEGETARCIAHQEALGLDVLVHGEFERTDMVEYFGEQLDGFAFTEHGWVQSYGSRCVKPPILFGDIARPRPMTVAWARYAQAQTQRPMKGMLTGPVTILQWSFVRDDQPRSETCRQLGLALRDEVIDLEAAGIPMIQVDEPALREGLPLRRGEQRDYLRWAVDAFRIATSGVADATQIHTHMCYAEFGDILDAVAALDADVVSIETSRSQMELLGDFARFRYPNDVGPGVYDIHSPRVPTVAEMTVLLDRAIAVVSPDRLWVNPDCGLKTRGWPEVEAALGHMVEAARLARARLAAR
jgi:5-methyltetrahydropteroyltriglutamate--homocysteine methyltransferase